MTTTIIFLLILSISWAWIIYELKHAQSISIEEEAAMDDALNAELKDRSSTTFEKA